MYKSVQRDTSEHNLVRLVSLFLFDSTRNEGSIDRCKFKT